MKELLHDSWHYTLGAASVLIGMTLALIGAWPSAALASDPYISYQLPDGVEMHIPQSGDIFLSPLVIACLVIAALCVVVVGLLLWRKR